MQVTGQWVLLLALVLPTASNLKKPCKDSYQRERHCLWEMQPKMSTDSLEVEQTDGVMFATVPQALIKSRQVWWLHRKGKT